MQCKRSMEYGLIVNIRLMRIATNAATCAMNTETVPWIVLSLRDVRCPRNLDDRQIIIWAVNSASRQQKDDCVNQEQCSGGSDDYGTVIFDEEHVSSPERRKLGRIEN